MHDSVTSVRDRAIGGSLHAVWHEKSEITQIKLYIRKTWNLKVIFKMISISLEWELFFIFKITKLDDFFHILYEPSFIFNETMKYLFMNFKLRR